MLLAEAVRLIDERVAAGATLKIKECPPATYGRHSIPTTWDVGLGPIPIDDVQAYPACTAWSMDDAIISIGEFLVRVKTRAWEQER